MGSWRVAPAVKAIFTQANLQAPDRSKAHDGTIGDTSHAARRSDHNPDAAGWVYAGDLTDDDKAGIDCREIARQIVARRDRRVKYLISEGRMVSSYSTSSRKAWEWGPYSGPNGHFKHLHVSVLSSWRSDTSPWWAPPATPDPTPASPVDQEDDMPIIARGSSSKKYLTDLLTVKRWIRSTDTVKALKAAGIREVQDDALEELLASVPNDADIA